MNKMLELRQKRAALLDEVQALNAAAEKEDRDFNPTEQTSYDGKMKEALDLANRIARLEASERAFNDAGLNTGKAPVQNRLGVGDGKQSQERAFCHFLRTGDEGPMREQRASNDTDMNVGTSADGGYAVPTGHYQGIIARRDEQLLTTKLNMMPIPGKGTTVNVPVDNEADGEFIVTNEAAAYDRDAPAINQVAMTLLKYTKKIELSKELLRDEDSRLLAFLEDFVARGMAKTHNSLLLTEVAANGTALKTFASATAIAFGELEDMVGNNDLGPYLEDDRSVAWVTRNATFWDVKSIVGSDRQYAVNTDSGKTILGYPVAISQKVAATAASAKDIYFGNWNLVGWREGMGFGVVRDPYTLAHLGQIRLIYDFDAVYKVLQAEAIGYGVHPSA